MNKIRAEIDKSEYDYDDFLNYRIDGYWLDEKLQETYQDSFLTGIIPTLLGMDMEEEEKVVWKRILPEENKVVNCPILMCEDDNDFSCTLIIAEIENNGKTIKWNKLGIDQTREFGAEKVGTTVHWFDKMPSLEFDKSEYIKMVDAFKQ